MSEITQQEIQVDMEEAQSIIDEHTALERLYTNPDFKLLILKGYFKDEAARLVEIKAAPAMQGEQQQKMVVQAMDSIGGLQQHFNKIVVLADQARSAMQDAEEELEDMNAGV